MEDSLLASALRDTVRRYRALAVTARENEKKRQSDYGQGYEAGNGNGYEHCAEMLRELVDTHIPKGGAR